MLGLGIQVVSGRAGTDETWSIEITLHGQTHHSGHAALLVAAVQSVAGKVRVRVTECLVRRGVMVIVIMDYGGGEGLRLVVVALWLAVVGGL